MPYSNADINAWLAANRGASDGLRRETMDRYGVRPGQVARATGVSRPEVDQRYQNARYGSADINGWLAANPAATDLQRRQAMDQYNVTTGDVAGATGMGQGEVQSRYDGAAPLTLPPDGGGPFVGPQIPGVTPPGSGMGGSVGSMGASQAGRPQWSGSGDSSAPGTSSYGGNALMRTLQPGYGGGMGGPRPGAHAYEQPNALMGHLNPRGPKNWRSGGMY